MKSYDPETQAYYENASGIIARQLVWVTAKDRDTGLPEKVGFWSGDQKQTFSIGGVDRVYHAAGTLIGMDQISAKVGLQVQMHTVNLSPLSPEVTAAIRLFDARLAPVEIHQALFDPETRNLVSEPVRKFRGWIDEIDILEPEEGGEASCTVSIASTTRILTRGLSLKKSDESQRRRGNDRFYKYTDITDAVPVYWGEEKASVT